MYNHFPDNTVLDKHFPVELLVLMGIKIEKTKGRKKPPSFFIRYSTLSTWGLCCNFFPDHIQIDFGQLVDTQLAFCVDLERHMAVM